MIGSTVHEYHKGQGFSRPYRKYHNCQIMLFVCHPKILHKHCLQFLLGVEIHCKTVGFFPQNW